MQDTEKSALRSTALNTYTINEQLKSINYFKNFKKYKLKSQTKYKEKDNENKRTEIN